MKRERPKRATSLNVDYDLKKSKIILPEESRKYKKRNKLNNGAAANSNGNNNINKKHNHTTSSSTSSSRGSKKTNGNNSKTNLSSLDNNLNIKVKKDGTILTDNSTHKKVVDRENSNPKTDLIQEGNSAKFMESNATSNDHPNSKQDSFLVKDKDGNVIDLVDENLLTTTRLKLSNKENTNTKDFPMNGLLNADNEITVNDVLSRTTGLPLSYFPNERIKKERLWNYKKILKQEKNMVMKNNTISKLQIDNKMDNSSIISPLNSNNNSNLNINNELTSNGLKKQEKYNNGLKTNEYKKVSHESCLRHVIGTDRDILDNSKDIIINPIPLNSHIKSKPLISKNKLFNQDSFNENDNDNLDIDNINSNKKIINKKNSSTTPITLSSTPLPLMKDNNNNNNIKPDLIDNELDFENDDFCSSCKQSGSFLCCDTCPKSFHFLCLDPPIDPNNLPEGNWSCINCQFKSLNTSNKLLQINEREFIADRRRKLGHSNIFDKLLFHLTSINPKQFNLPTYIKDTFKDVRTGDNSQYTDDTEKIPLTERQMFNTSYGQSITKLDSYSPENHFDNNNNFLICYKCHQTKLGTWNKPEDSRLLIKCDYCDTPWHLDCIPNVPRASLKNLGLKWKCPLHANTAKQRRLNKKQPYLEPSNQIGFANNGDIEIILDEIELDKKFNDWKKIGQLNPIPKLPESSIKFDFISKIYDYKRLIKKNEIKSQESLIDKLIYFEHSNSNISELSSLLYFKYCNNEENKNNNNNSNSNSLENSVENANNNNNKTTTTWKKIWDFKELCHIANEEYDTEKENANLKDVTQNNKVSETNEDDINMTLTTSDINQLLFIKKIIESKPREEVIEFFNLSNNLQQ